MLVNIFLRTVNVLSKCHLQRSSNLHNLNCLKRQLIRKYSAEKMSKKAMVLIADGSEELEFCTAVDVLRRGGINVTVAGLKSKDLVTCSRCVNILPDDSLCNSASKGPFDVIVLPGGLGGSQAFCESEALGRVLAEQDQSKKYIAAICAAPLALKQHGIAHGKRVTCYPSVKKHMEENGKYILADGEVVVDGHIITSRGPGTAIEFALTIIKLLISKEKAVEVAEAMLYSYQG